MNRIISLMVGIVALSFIGCGGGSGGGSSSQSSSTTEVWSGKGAYDYCTNYANGEYTFTYKSGILSKLTYSGDKWHHDCTTTSLGSVTYDVSNLNISEPISKDGFKTLFAYVYNHYLVNATNRYTAEVGQYSDGYVELSLTDNYDGSVEIVKLTKSTNTHTVDYSGNYSGSFTGYRNGTWQATVSTNGTIIGTAVDNQGYSYSLNGQMYNNQMVMSDSSNYVTFRGDISSSGTVSGNWTTAQGNSGSFSGTKQ